MNLDSPYTIGEVALYSFPDYFVPAQWLKCDGTILPINDKYSVIYSMIGIQFGGDGRTTFALPGPAHLPPLPAGTKAAYYICWDGAFPYFE